MIDTFKNKRAVFEKLASDLCALPQAETFWIDSRSSPKLPLKAAPELPLKDLQQYYALLKEIGAVNISVSLASKDPRLHKRRPCSVEIDAWWKPYLDGGDSKSWVTFPLPNPNGRILKKLEAIDFSSAFEPRRPDSSWGHRDYLRHIDGNWWLQWNHGE